MTDTETMAAFGASEAACYHWPSDAESDRRCREAYCMGAGWSAKEIKRLRAALQFYADKENWRSSSILDMECPMFDGWTPAREALKQ